MMFIIYPQYSEWEGIEIDVKIRKWKGCVYYTIKSNLRQYHNMFVEKLKSQTNIGIIFSKCGGFEVCPDLEKNILD